MFEFPYFDSAAELERTKNLTEKEREQNRKSFENYMNNLTEEEIVSARSESERIRQLYGPIDLRSKNEY